MWEYFVEGDGSSSDARCILCEETVKSSGNTSNMLKHLKIKHTEQYDKVHEVQEEAKRQKQQQAPSMQKKQMTLIVTIE